MSDEPVESSAQPSEEGAEPLIPPPTFEEAAIALVHKLVHLTSLSPIHTGYGYLHIIKEGELEPELSDLKAYTDREEGIAVAGPEPPPSEVPQNV